MRIGISSYCLDREIESGALTLSGAIEWAAQNMAECMELVPFAFKFEENGKIDTVKIKQTVSQARDAGVALCNYSVLADFCKTGADFEAEVERVKMHVQIASELGLERMRHDVTAFRRPQNQNSLVDFEKWLPVMAEGASRVCEYAKTLGVMTLIENHGFFANGIDRTERILLAVDNPNYALLLDTGNIVCVDEDASAAAKALASKAKMIHLKDFYIRRRDPGDSTLFDCGGHWFRSRAGLYLRGAILAQGDLDIYDILSQIKASGYDGDIVIEFEGLEDARYATGVGLQNAIRIWNGI